MKNPVEPESSMPSVVVELVFAWGVVEVSGPSSEEKCTTFLSLIFF